MIGKPEWFARRKYGGWGVRPKTWQGWVYLAVALLPFIAFHSYSGWSNETRIIVTIVWLGVLLIDVFDIMIRMRKDERDHKIEAIAERNAAWTMTIVITAAILYQVISSGLQQRVDIDWWLAAALIGGVIAKATSNLYLERTTL